MLFGVNKLVGLGHWGLIMQKHAKMWSYDGVITVISLDLYFFRVLFLDYFAWVINLLLSNRNHIHFMLVGKHEGWYIFDQQCLIWWARAAQKWPILVQFWTKNDQTWQAWLFSKGSKMAYLMPILLPFWTIFCPLARKTQGVCFEANNHFFGIWRKNVFICATRATLWLPINTTIDI